MIETNIVYSIRTPTGDGHIVNGPKIGANFQRVAGRDWIIQRRITGRVTRDHRRPYESLLLPPLPH